MVDFTAIFSVDTMASRVDLICGRHAVASINRSPRRVSLAPPAQRACVNITARGRRKPAAARAGNVLARASASPRVQEEPTDSRGLSKRNALVTGCISGIGLATALHLASEGWNVYAGVLDETEAASLASRGNANMRPLVLDVTSESNAAAAAELISKEAGSLDAVINNAGVGLIGPMEHADITQWSRVLDINVVGVVRVTQLVLPLLRKGGSPGRIVVIGSVAGTVATGYASAYYASKHALEGLCDAMRQELQPSGVQVSLVKPGALPTPLWLKTVLQLQQNVQVWPDVWSTVYGEGMSQFLEAFVAQASSEAISTRDVVAAIHDVLTASESKPRYFVPRAAAVTRWRNVMPDRLWDWLLQCGARGSGLSADEATKVLREKYPDV